MGTRPTLALTIVVSVISLHVGGGGEGGARLAVRVAVGGHLLKTLVLLPGGSADSGLTCVRVCDQQSAGGAESPCHPMVKSMD